MLAGGQSTLLASKDPWALEGESEDGSCSGSRILLLIAAGMAFRALLTAPVLLIVLAGLQLTHEPKVR